ncbi:mucin-3A-like [Ranitomeya variabilis]|uniref:mucin-3A-like n=1 Tax=Ranitomeya variabilis TaxID=490064 RepID=UPI004056DD5F
MARLYSETPHYKGIFQGVEIINITNGSIIVEHILLLKIYADEYNEIVDEVFTLLNNTNCTSDTKTECLCFKANTTKVQPVPLDFKEICLKSLDIPKDFQEYYSPVNVSGKTTCVSRCSVNSKDPINCNKGQCSVTRQGPNCYCETSPNYWYSGDLCQTAISKPGVYAGVSVGLFVLLVIIIALSVILYRRRRLSNKERLIDENRWYEEGWEEENRGPAASYSNSSASDSAVPVNSIFLPDLEKVNTSMKVTVPRANVVLSGNTYERTT